MQAHAGVLQQLATSTHQWKYDHIFASIPIYDGSNREEFFLWLDRLEAACYYCGRDIKTEALGRSAGPVQNVLMALPHTKSWSAIREELKRCFYDQISLGHTAAQLENMTQKPNEPLRLYIYWYSKLHKAVTQKDACHDTDPSRWLRFFTSIMNTSIADKVTRSKTFPITYNNASRKLWNMKPAFNYQKVLTWLKRQPSLMLMWKRKTKLILSRMPEPHQMPVTNAGRWDIFNETANTMETNQQIVKHKDKQLWILMIQ